jgi:hypothetical protein
MRKITRNLFITKDSLRLIDTDINAVDKYTIFSNKEEGTIEVEVSFSVPEEFKVTEDVLFEIVASLTPALSEKEHELKLSQVINHLRNLGLSL